jgi:hypothetical protein
MEIIKEMGILGGRKVSNPMAIKPPKLESPTRNKSKIIKNLLH